MANVSDMKTVYVKPSLKGELIFRRPVANQKSARLKARQEAVKAAGEAGRLSKAAHDTLVSKGKCPIQRVYKPNVGYEEKPVCPIKEMRKALSPLMRSA
jgi:hypothetical protein